MILNLPYFLQCSKSPTYIQFQSCQQNRIFYSAIKIPADDLVLQAVSKCPKIARLVSFHFISNGASCNITRLGLQCQTPALSKV